MADSNLYVRINHDCLNRARAHSGEETVELMTDAIIAWLLSPSWLTTHTLLMNTVRLRDGGAPPYDVITVFDHDLVLMIELPTRVFPIEVEGWGIKAIYTNHFQDEFKILFKFEDITEWDKSS